MASVILIEFNAWHGECLEPQMEYLKASGHSVELFCTSKALASAGPTCLDGRVHHTECPGAKGFRNIWTAWRLIWRLRPDFVILNTAQGSEALKLSLLPMPRRTKFVGTIHNLAKLTGSTGQKIISRRMDGYYVAAKYLLDTARARSGKPCQFYSPLDKTAGATQTDSDLKKDGETLLCVPGAIEYKRRNYAALLNLAASPALKSVKFVLLCNRNKGDGPQFMQEVETQGLTEHFVTFDHFVEADLFERYIRACDYLLPLVDDVMPGGESYKTSKISGTFALAASYGKTMLCNKFLDGISGFNYPCVFYADAADLARVIRSGEKGAFSPLNFETERARYDSLLKVLSGE